MKQVMHIITRTDDAFCEQVRSWAAAAALDDPSPIVVDLTEGTPDYDRLLEQVFQADAVQVW